MRLCLATGADAPPSIAPGSPDDTPGRRADGTRSVTRSLCPEPHQGCTLPLFQRDSRRSRKSWPCRCTLLRVAEAVGRVGLERTREGMEARPRPRPRQDPSRPRVPRSPASGKIFPRQGQIALRRRRRSGTTGSGGGSGRPFGGLGGAKDFELHFMARYKAGRTGEHAHRGCLATVLGQRPRLKKREKPSLAHVAIRNTPR